MTDANGRNPGGEAASAHSSAGSPATSSYQDLVARGLDTNEAANLTAFINGLTVRIQPWKIRELSHVLFLRELCRSGSFGEADGAER